MGRGWQGQVGWNGAGHLGHQRRVAFHTPDATAGHQLAAAFRRRMTSSASHSTVSGVTSVR